MIDTSLEKMFTVYFLRWDLFLGIWDKFWGAFFYLGTIWGMSFSVLRTGQYYVLEFYTEVFLFLWQPQNGKKNRMLPSS